MRADYGNDDLNRVIEELRHKLVDYLREKEVLPPEWTRENNNKFRCINPNHEDKNPSMSFIPGSEFRTARCFGCQEKVDIFKAATFLEGLPDSDKEWITDTVYGLARQFEIDFTEHQPTPEELARAKVIEMLADAADCLVGLISTSKKCNGFQHTLARGIGEEICKKMGVGTVDWDEFADTMFRYGSWTRDFMEAHGVSSKTFGQEFITITLRDHRGMCVGFDRRYALYDKDAEAEFRKLGKGNDYPKKWYLPRKSDIFEPRTFLFGLHIAKEKSFRQLDIVEGYFDALAGMQAGHDTIVACCGTSGLNDEQMELLVKLGFEDICIVFDSDLPGQKAMEKYLKDFGGRREFRLKFKFLNWPDQMIPEKDRDPDTYFRLYCKKNLEAYNNEPVFSAFRMALQIEMKRGTEGNDLARAQIPHIAGETDPLLRGSMIRELAEKTGVAEIDIRNSVDHILSGKARNIARDLLRDLQKDASLLTPGDLSALIKKAEAKLSPLFGGSALAVTARAARANFDEALDFFDNDRGVIPGYRTGIDFIDNNLGGVQKKAFWVLFGNPNSGKSALAHNIVSGMVKNIKENKDLCALFFSFDDTLSWTWAKQLAIFTGFPIKWIARPQTYIYHDPERTRKYNEAKEFFRRHTGDSIRIFGGDIGMNVSQIKKAIADAQDSAGGKHCVIIVDSFNKLQSVDDIEGHEKFARNADELHALMHHGHTVIVTAETVKAAQGRKPTIADLADTKKISFDATLCSSVYNPLHEEREKANFFHMREDPDKGWVKAAVVQVDMVKNKQTDEKGNCVLQFDDHIGSFSPISDIKKYMITQRQLWNQYGNKQNLSYANDDEEELFEDVGTSSIMKKISGVKFDVEQ